MNGALCARLVNLEVRVYDLIHQVEGLVAGVVGRVLAHTLVFLGVVFEPEAMYTFLLPYSSVLNRTSVPNSTRSSGLRKKHTPNRTHSSGL